MKIKAASFEARSPLLLGGIAPGVYPYVGGSVSVGDLHAIVKKYGGAVVAGPSAPKTVMKVPGALIDPARYLKGYGSFSDPEPDPDSLFDFSDEDWLKRQQSAGVPVILTDPPRIKNGDRDALREALRRWDPTEALVVLPIQPWWLTKGLPWLIEDVKSVNRPVAIVLTAVFNGLDAAGAVKGLVDFMKAVDPVPVVMLRCDISAVGAVAHGAYAGFVGCSTSTRHDSLPPKRPDRGDRDDSDQDKSPSTFVYELHDYFKASGFSGIERFGFADVLRCEAGCCGPDGLLGITNLVTTDLSEARQRSYRHNMAVTDLVARRVFADRDPRAAWRESCLAGKETIYHLNARGLNPDGHDRNELKISVSSWLRQWLDIGLPLPAPRDAG